MFDHIAMVLEPSAQIFRTGKLGPNNFMSGADAGIALR
jgi:hypothetical protein